MLRKEIAGDAVLFASQIEPSCSTHSNFAERKLYIICFVFNLLLNYYNQCCSKYYN